MTTLIAILGSAFTLAVVFFFGFLLGEIHGVTKHIKQCVECSKRYEQDYARLLDELTRARTRQDGEDWKDGE